MSWTNPKSWGTEVATSADMNTYVGSNTEYLYDNTPTANQWIGGTVNVDQLNQRIESGTNWTAITTAAYGSKYILFGASFGSAPRVVGNVMTAAGVWSPMCRAIGTDGFTFVGGLNAGTYTGTMLFNWLAIGA